MASKAALVDQIKGIQRSDAGAKQAWWDYCDTHLGGVKDPNRHEPDTLSAFLASYSAGGGGGGARRAPAPAPAYGAPAPAWGAYAQPYAPIAPIMPAAAYGKAYDAAGGLAEAIKTGQRKSANWKEAWQAYVALYGSGFNDPGRYDDAFISAFLDYLGQLATADLTTAAAESGINLQEAMANPKPSGIKRPLDAAGMPPAKRVAVGGGGELAAGMGGEKAQLVEKIKALQRSDPAAKEAWQAFCDQNTQGAKDPNRQDVALLQQFVANYA